MKPSHVAPRAPRLRPLLTCLGLLLLVAAAGPYVGRAARRSGAGQPPAAARLPKVGAAEFVPGEALVRFRSEAKAAGVQASGARLELPDGSSAVVRVSNFRGSEIVPGLRLARFEAADTLAAIHALNRRADVLYAEPNYIWRKQATPNDTRYAELYAMPKISAPAAWDTTTGSKSVVVAVIDEGVDLSHPDLAPNAWANPGETPNNNADDDGNGFIDDVTGWDFVHDDKTTFDAADGDDHGTHVAGTVGARGNNAAGVTGVNWQVSLMSIKVLGPDGGATSDIIAGYNYVRTMRQRGVNVRVTNNSYGGPGFSQSALDAINALGGEGVLVVAAAGNDSRDNFSFPQFPASYDAANLLAVASTTSSDTLSSFSNFSSRSVSMGAPGSSILSTTPGNTYSIFSGTSMATPHVAGAAALLLSAAPNISLANLRGALAFTGDRIAALETNTTTGRRLNVRAALDAAMESDTTAPAQATPIVTAQTGRSLTLTFAPPGDDGTAGTAADYDFFFVNPTLNTRVLMPTSVAPAAGGASQSVTVATPYRGLSGTIQMVAYDNRGNQSTSTLGVNLQPDESTDPYVVTQSAAAALSTGGTRLAIDGDDKYSTQQALPFAFPFFNQSRTALTVSSNGALYFSTPPRRDSGDADDVPSSVAGLQGQTMLAALWDDLEVSTARRSDAGVFVVQPDSTRVIYRWQATTFFESRGVNRGVNAVNFEVELRADGTIIFRYGAGNQNLFPVAGISGGEPSAYDVTSHTSENALKNLTNAQAVTFTPRASQPPPPPSGCNSPTPISFGQTASGNLAAGDCQNPIDGSFYDAYTFTGAAGQLVIIDMNSAAFDAYLYLLRPGETALTYRTIFNDDTTTPNGDTSLDSRVVAVLPETGTYTIFANSAFPNETGAYQLQLRGGCAATALAANTTANGSLASGDCQMADGTFVDVYSFNATADQQVSVSMSRTSGTVDPFLFLLSNDGFTELARNDDGLTGGGDGNFGARIPAPPTGAGAGLATLRVAGTYYVLANSFAAGQTGNYQLTLTVGANCPVQAISAGQTTTGQQLTTSDCRLPLDGSFMDVYTFEGTAGQQIAVTMAANAPLDSYLLLLDPAGFLLEEDNDGAGGDNARIPATSGFRTLPFTGTYRIYANAAAPGLTGAYQLSVAAASVPALRIDTVAPAAGRASGGQQVVLTGSFDGLSSVGFGGVFAPFTFTNGTSEITVTTPPHAPGAVGIVLMAAASGASHTKPNAFAYLPTTFTDNTLVAGVTTARAQHILELRQAADALRAVAGLQPAQWTDPALPPAATFIKAIHIAELRARLEEAAAALGFAPFAYTDPNLGPGSTIKRVHIEELRQRVRNIAEGPQVPRANFIRTGERTKVKRPAASRAPARKEVRRKQ